MSDQQLITALEQSVNDAHGRAMELGGATCERMLALANAITQCGGLLWRCKEKCVGSWTGKFTQGDNIGVFPFSIRTAQRYMRVAERHPEKFDSWQEAHPFLKEVGIITGNLKTLERDRGNPGPSLLDKFLGLFGRFQNTWIKGESETTIAKMSDHAKEQLEQQLISHKATIDRALELVRAKP